MLVSYILYNHTSILQAKFSDREGVWSKNSCGLSLVVFEQPAKPFTTLQRATSFACWARRRKEQDIALALMITLLMVMVHILVEHVPEGALAEQHQPGQRVVFDRSY